MTTISVPRSRGTVVPRVVAVVAALLVLLGIATVVHARSVAKPASTSAVVSQTAVPDFPVVPPIRHGKGVTLSSLGTLALVDRAGTGSAEAHRLGGRTLPGPAVTAAQPAHGTHAYPYPTTAQFPVHGRRGADL